MQIIPHLGDASIFCNVPFVLKWELSGVKIRSFRSFKVVHIDKVTKAKEGEYTCIGYNSNHIKIFGRSLLYMDGKSL